MKRRGRPKKKRGRPSAYKKVYCHRIIEYFDQEPYEDIKVPHYKNGEVAWMDTRRVVRQLPTLYGFAKANKIAYQTIHNWINPENPQFKQAFLDAFTRAKGLQKNFLIQAGLQGLYNPAFAIFTAKNITDMRDVQKVETEHIERLQLEVIHVEIAERLNFITDDLQSFDIKAIPELIPGRSQG